MEDPAFKGTGAVIDLLRDRAFSASGLAAFTSGWFTFGTLDWTIGANAGRRTEVLGHDVSRPVSDETYVAQSFTPEGVGLRPFSVAHVEKPWRTPRTPGDLTIRWTRRSRALAADSWGGLEVPLAEELEAYEVEILDGPTVKRVLSTTTTSALYTTAQQTADWGAPLTPGESLTIRIFQLSALVGRGAPKLVTLTF